MLSTPPPNAIMQSMFSAANNLSGSHKNNVFMMFVFIVGLLAITVGFMICRNAIDELIKPKFNSFYTHDLIIIKMLSSFFMIMCGGSLIDHDQTNGHIIFKFMLIIFCGIIIVTGEEYIIKKKRN